MRALSELVAISPGATDPAAAVLLPPLTLARRPSLLPARLSFRQMQSSLFPVYFKTLSALSLVLVGSQLFHHLPQQSLKHLRTPSSLQAVVVLGHLFAHVYNGFALGPRVVDVMRDRARQEKEEGKSCTDADVRPWLWPGGSSKRRKRSRLTPPPPGAASLFPCASDLAQAQASQQRV